MARAATVSVTPSDISVPVAVIRHMRESLGKRFTQSDLKAVVSAFWSGAVAHLVDPASGHRLNVSNVLTLRLAERDAQVFTVPRTRGASGPAATVAKPPRWHLTVEAKDRLKAVLEAGFARARGISRTKLIDATT
jgi:hypothetical protein